jgi:acetyl-CoA acyltransferase 1
MFLSRPLLIIPRSGGSIALTHPLGMSTLAWFDQSMRFLTIVSAGVRQVVTGLTELRRRNGDLLLTSMCVGSGMGAAGIFVNEVHSAAARL